MLDFKLAGHDPVYAEIVDQVCLAVAGGKLRPGDRLETVRALARRLGVNPSTAARAYQRLEQMGVIETNRRGGSVVARGSDTLALRVLREGRLHGLAERAVVEALAQGFMPDEIEAALGLELATWRERRGSALPPRVREDTGPHLLRFAGSHDLALEALWAQARRSRPEVTIRADYVGSLDGLLALLHGEAQLVGAHLLDEESGDYNLPILRRLFVGEPLCVITLAERAQGLIVPAGNPKQLHSFASLAAPGIRIVNRQPGSGTRVLLDHQLRLCGIRPRSVSGYEREVATHLAVAEAVARGDADAGLGLLAAARALGLDFVPLVRERYDLVLLAEDRSEAPLAWLIDLVKSPAYAAVVAELGGYNTRLTGRETYL